MHHIGTVTKSSKFELMPFHAQCSCGPAGHFATKEEAEGYLQGHFAKQGGISTVELVDKSDEPEVVPAPALTHAPLPQPQTVEQMEHDSPAQGEVAAFPDSEIAPVAAPVAEGETNWKKKKK